jgi:pseudaminic acid cytidylyltransferase
MIKKNLCCIIPARGGSKRIPKKNIKLFLGKPMIAYAIEVAKKSNLFSDIYVSTDCEFIANVAKEYGANVPFFRPSFLADDFAGTVPVIKHAIECIELLNGNLFEEIFCIYPCVPLLTPEDLICAYINKDKLKEPNRYIFSIAEFHSAPQRAFKLGRNGETLSLYPENERIRTQDLEKTYYDAGQFYCGSRDLWVKEKNLHEFGIGYVIPSVRSIDIDTENDWLMAEIRYKIINQHNEKFN